MVNLCVKINKFFSLPYRTPSSDENKPFKCETCSQEFSDIGDIRKHFRGEFGKGVIYLALADPQEFFKQHLTKIEE